MSSLCCSHEQGGGAERLLQVHVSRWLLRVAPDARDAYARQQNWQSHAYRVHELHHQVSGPQWEELHNGRSSTWGGWWVEVNNWKTVIVMCYLFG